MPSFCAHCGAAANPGASFCHACGTGLAATPMAPAGATGAPFGAGQAVERVRPTGVTVIGVVTVAFGAFAAMAALAVMLFFGAMGALFGIFLPFAAGEIGAFAGILGIVLAIVILAFAGLTLAAGIGTLRGASWAWALMIVLMALNALRGIGELAERSIGGVITIGVSALVIWYFLQPDVKRWFARA